MNNTTDDSSFLPPLSDSDDPGDSPMIQHFRNLECQIAQRIIAWLTAPDLEFPYYRDYILLATPDVLHSKFMDDLAFGIYRHLDASSWLSWHDAPGSSSALWRHGIIRASRLLNTPA